MRRCSTAWQSASPTGPECCTAAGRRAEHPFGSIKHWMGHGGFLMRRLENVRGEFSLTALAYNIRRATTLAGIPELIAAWGVQTSWNRPPPKGLLQRIRAHGISESTTTHSRPKSQASHTAKFDSGLLFTQSRAVTQHSRSRRVFKDLGVSKRYFSIDSIGDIFVQ